MSIDHDIKNPSPADQGPECIEWALAEMPVLSAIHDRFARQRPLTGVRNSGCLHIRTETAKLARTLKAGGAELVLCTSNPLRAQDEVVAALDGRKKAVKEHVLYKDFLYAPVSAKKNAPTLIPKQTG
ncbi:MAG: adenosylhomocysteinase [Methylobacter sp.]